MILWDARKIHHESVRPTDRLPAPRGAARQLVLERSVLLLRKTQMQLKKSIDSENCYP
jgi:hypothetical protein